MASGDDKSELNGARIWLSGSLPEEGESTAEERQRILDFVRAFAREVFARGGHIVHGTAGQFTEALLDEARRDERRDRLTLAISRFFSKQREPAMKVWREVAIVQETPEVKESKEASLEELRRWMVSRCDAIVVVGGKWWRAKGREGPGLTAGIPNELRMAQERGLPCFLLAGLGGVAKQFTRNGPDIFGDLKNGWDAQQNLAFAERSDNGLARDVCDQLARLPLVRGTGSDGAAFRILALDGGGVKGAFTAAVLATWEEHTGLLISDHFELIAGTSTGGILAIALGLGLRPQEILTFYEQRGKVIFPITSLGSRWRHKIRSVFRPKFANDVLLAEIRSALYGDGSPKLLGESKCRLVIPAYHAVAGQTDVFRTPHTGGARHDGSMEAALVALATSAAPTYFRAALVANSVAGNHYLDGGVWANTPTLAAVVEAVCILKRPMERLDVLSIGTTDEPFSAGPQIGAGLLGWARGGKILNLLMQAQQHSSVKLTGQFLGAPRLLRVNEITRPGSYRLDDALQVGLLAELGNQAAKDDEVLRQVKSRFLNGRIALPWRL